MMDIKQYIADLLYRYECVIVPEFGAFLTQYKSAQVHSTTNAFYPPTKEISFNAQLNSNDGLLASYIATAENKKYEEAVNELKKVVTEWNSVLNTGKKITLDNIGVLRLSEENKLQFQPSYHINYLTDSFGLSSFVSNTIGREISTPKENIVIREELKKEVVALEDRSLITVTPDSKRKNRSYLKYAAILLVAFSIGSTTYSFYKKNNVATEIAREEADVIINKKIDNATFIDNIELSKITLNLSKKEKAKSTTKKYHIIAGAFRAENNAIKKVRQLKRRNFEASKIGENKFGLHQVAYASFDDVKEALAYLRKMKRTETKDAWLFTSKNK